MGFCIGKKLYDSIGTVWDHVESVNDQKQFLLISKDISPEYLSNIQSRFEYYCPGKNLNWSCKYSSLITSKRTLLFGNSFKNPLLMWIIRIFFRNIYYVDFRNNPSDGWEWIRLLNNNILDNDLSLLSKDRFSESLDAVMSENLNKCYLFGTGPSLENALKHDFSDGYRVVCNTIGKDKELWDHLSPHFIVAGDPIYHFGHTQYAKSFRSDLLDRLMDSSTYFMYPQEYHPIVSREFGCVSDKLLPIPIERSLLFNSDLRGTYSLPWLDNVFGMMLLPLGCTLSSTIYLWGFDGRAPKDKLFWSTSSKHNYEEYMVELRNAHPKFYDARVPIDNPAKYFRNTFGDQLDNILTQAESSGYQFIMMHPSWTPCFQKRCVA